MTDKKFDPAKLERLTDPARLESIDPDVLWDAAGTPDARTVLDIGSGPGLFTFEFARRMSGGTVHALDTEQVMLDWIATHTPEDLPARVTTSLSQESTLPIRDAHADLVVMINLHHELDDPVALLRDVLRVLRPQGRLVIVDWKAEETPSGPVLEHRIPAHRICEDVVEAGFAECEADTDSLPWHSLVTATRLSALG